MLLKCWLVKTATLRTEFNCLFAIISIILPAEVVAQERQDVHVVNPSAHECGQDRDLR